MQNKNLSSRLFWAISVTTVCALMIWGATTPHLLGKGYQTDKMLHIFIFGIFAAIFCAKFYKLKYQVIIAIVLFALGICIEFMQFLAPERNPQWADIAANVIGILYGILAGNLLRSGYFTAPNKHI